MISACKQAPVATQQALTRLGRFVGRRAGMLKEPFPTLLSAQLPDLFVFNISDLGSGAALTEEEALICAIGEAIERYSGSNYEPEDDVVCAYRALDGEAVHPSRFALFSESQYRADGFPFARFTEETVIRWTTGYSLLRKKEIKAPACLTYLAHQTRSGENLINASSSNGLACHSSREQATLKSLYEVIERDAFFIMWLNRLSMPTLRIDETGWLRELFEEKLEKPGFEYHFIDLTTDIGVPVVGCLARGRYRDKMIVGVGASANLSPSLALLKAAVEAGHTLVWADNMMSRGEWVFDPGYSNIPDFADHVRLYCEPQMQPELDFIIRSEKVSRVSDLPDRSTGSAAQEIEICLEALERQGLDAIQVDLTPPEVAEAGLAVIKVIVPEAIGVNGDHRYRPLGGERIYETPRRLGYTHARIKEEELNPAPHPFP
ncbi:MAG: YcaO-like family protein [Acidobacteria bacterium]|nr:YcaO-like family protein [Acidobacteriota bacterium]